MTLFLQSDAWQRFQTAYGRQTFTASGPGWNYLAIVERGKLSNRLYCPYGPVASSKSALQDALASLKKLAHEQSLDFVRIEPTGADFLTQEMQELGLVKAARSEQPHHVWQVDLTLPEDNIIAAMNATARNLHRNIAKKGVTFKKSNDPADLTILLNFLHEVAQKDGFTPMSDHYLQTVADTLFPNDDASLFIAYFENQPIAAAMVYDSTDTRIYAHAAADYAHRNLSAGIPLVSTIMLEAKDKGLKTFDMWGIAPDDQPNHRWAGFTKFKKSFGGASKDYVGTWELPVNSLKYRLYSSALTVFRKLR